MTNAKRQIVSPLRGFQILDFVCPRALPGAPKIAPLWGLFTNYKLLITDYHFALNLNVRYHVVDFDYDYLENGLELGFGFSFMWGDFVSN